MIILDTNVISELLRPMPEPRVEAWLASRDRRSIRLTAISEAELRYGVALLAAGRRRDELAFAIDRILRLEFRDRILSFDSEAAQAFASIAADRRRAGRPISQLDCQIAAIARARDATVATRNDRDFESCGVRVTNPWTERPQS